MSGPSFALLVHGRPARVRSHPENSGALTFDFDNNSQVTIFCEAADLCVDLHAAIQGVIEKHSTIATTGANQEAA